MSLNKVMVIGNVGKDPEMRFTPSGTPVANFSVATNEGYTDSEGERHEKTEWFNVVCWKKLAETCNQYVYKGMPVFVEGRQQTHSWEAEDGTTKYRTELVASKVEFLGRKADNEGEESQEIAEPDLGF
uniref:Putative single-stranded DNA-binding protein n=1 Tax=viral metagenome TaxID=1070528 RepID=A0A6M3LJ54_9ZZZZ